VVALTATGSVALLAVLALASGLITAIEMPVRQAYLTELVPEEEAGSAVAIHVTAWNTTRFIGPGLAGLCIAAGGVGLAFAAMALAAMIVVLSVLVVERIRTERRPRPVTTSSVLGALREGAAYAWAEPRIRWALVFLATGGIFGIQVFQTLAPLYVSESLGLAGGAYGAFVAISGLGAVVSAYVITYLARGSRWTWLVAGSGGLAVLLAFLSVVSDAPAAFAISAALGVAQVALVQNALVTVQAATPDALRGRVMGLYVTLFQGTQPFGAFFAGWVAEIVGIRGAMLTGALVLGIVVVVGTVGLRRAGAIDALPVGRPATSDDAPEVTATAP
jgi:MFS family permease